MGLWSVLGGMAPRYLALRRSQYWDDATLRRYQHEALKRTLATAAKIPFYRDHFGGATGVEAFNLLPRLRRKDIRGLIESVRALHPDAASRFTSASSSGSTGTPAEFLFDRSHQIGRYATRARYLIENGWNPALRNVWLLHSGPFMGRDDAALVKSRAVLRSRFIHASTDFASLTKQVCDIDPVHLFAYPEYLAEMLKVIARNGSRFPSLRKIFTGSEVLDDAVRRRTREVLGVEIADGYGTTEGFIAWECPAGRYHVNGEHMLVEILDDAGRPAAPGEMGRVIITTLENQLMPLVRYEIGDYAIASHVPCSCGRSSATIDRVLGRELNLFKLPDGELMSPWDLVEVLRRYSEFRQLQVVQESFDRYLINFASEGPIASEIEQQIGVEFRRILGLDATVSYHRMTEVPRTRAGKFMIAISRLK